jgi:hypothetical protein
MIKEFAHLVNLLSILMVQIAVFMLAPSTAKLDVSNVNILLSEMETNVSLLFAMFMTQVQPDVPHVKQVTNLSKENVIVKTLNASSIHKVGCVLNV